MKTYDQFKQDLEANNLNGFYIGVPNSDYHNSPGISKSGLDRINHSPAHFKFAPPMKQTPAMRMGSAIHCAILEPHVFEKDYMMLENVTDRRNKEYKDAVNQIGADYVLTATDADKIKGMQAAIEANVHAMKQVEAPDAVAEVSVFATCENTGELLKCRFDLLNHGVALDLKKTKDARPETFAKSVHNYRYHVQAAFYNYVYRLATGNDLKAFAFLAIEEDAPHGNAIYTLDEDALNLGVMKYESELEKYHQCKEQDYWPNIESKPQVLSLPNWAYNA